MIKLDVKRGLTGTRSLLKTICIASSRGYSTTKTHDIAIVGGGPAGLTLAASLKNSPITKHLDIVMIEASDLGKIRNWQLPDDKYENRVSSLTPRSMQYLQSIGVWDCMEQHRVKKYDEMKVWDGVSGSRIEFYPHYLGKNEDIAYMVENFNLQKGLLTRLGQLAGDKHGTEVSILDKVRVSNIEYGHDTTKFDLSGWPVVTLESGEKLGARLLIGADGANSPVRKFSGIESRGWDYNTHGLVATLELEWEDFRSIAWQRFLKTGPIAMLPLPNGFASLVWSTKPEYAQHLKKLAPDDFVAMVNAAFRLGPVDLEYLHTLDSGIAEEVEWRLEHTELVDEDNMIPIPVMNVLEGSRAAFPLKMKHADTYIENRVALVGDAAHTTHPLAGQGMNMGQCDVANLTKAIETAVNRGQDIGSLLALEPYWKESYLPNHLKLGVVDKLHKLYSTDSFPIVKLRSWGLDLVNSSEMVKKFLMARASE